MNILPKKRWHVRTKQNIEKVRRDEAKAAEEEKELERRIRLAEQEARTDFLRKRAKGSSEDSLDSKLRKEGHVNFFEEIEKTGGYQRQTNEEYEAEEKARQEKFEKDIGLLTYLGQSSLEAKGETPWYLKAETKDRITGSDGKDETASLKFKSKLDPLNDMKMYLAIKDKNHGAVHKVITPKTKKDEDKNKSKSDKKLSKLDELRAKRLKREADEKRRSQQFLENYRRGSEKETVIMDDRLRQYNSQFNPHLARNNWASTKDHSAV